MKIINLTIIAFCLLLLNMPKNVLAGDAGGPYVIWVNLSNNYSIDAMLDKRLQDNDDRIPPDSIFLFRKRPTGITNDLVRKAVVKNDKAAIKKLDKLVRKPFEDFTKGFDGIIVYDEESGARLSSTTRGWNTFYREKLKLPEDPNSIWELFCTLIPEVTRKP